MFSFGSLNGGFGFGPRYLPMQAHSCWAVTRPNSYYYIRRRLASGEGIVSLGVTPSRVCLSVCPPTARRISLGGEGNALYPALSSHRFIVAK